MVSTHSRPKAAGTVSLSSAGHKLVSTHSRPKAAGTRNTPIAVAIPSFNTQPPEGGWSGRFRYSPVFLVSTHSRPKAAGRLSGGVLRQSFCFNTQPPEGGWMFGVFFLHKRHQVSTHSRPKAAGLSRFHFMHGGHVSTHSRPKAAGNHREVNVAA